jgi:poly-beta-1,6-N-acetyl-D-glucosamine synthase
MNNISRDTERLRYVVITPVRDEVQHIGRTIASMQAQTVQPVQWIVVDDGSTDGTSELLAEWSRKLTWMTVHHRADRGYRAAGSGVMDAFFSGLERVVAQDWNFLVKLDADLSFADTYFERCLRHFVDQPRLGIGGGTVYGLQNGVEIIDSTGDPPFHVRGATKIYRRECWDQISPLPRTPGWDTIDEVKANYRGWITRTFPELGVVQHKPTGGADGSLKNWFKNGRANYLTGYHPLFMVAKCVRRAMRRPLLVEGLSLLAGYCSAYLKRMPRQLERDVIKYLRREQLRRLVMRPSIYGSPRLS